MNKIQPLVFRVDSSIQIGTGHVMRCLALAQHWQDRGGETIFVMAERSSPLESRLHSEQIKTVYLSVKTGSNEDARQLADISHKFGASYVVVDGYHFGVDYQESLKNSGVNSLFFDDYGQSKHYYADLVLNQNISANEDLYNSRESYTQLLLGTEYTLLRREFWKWRDWQRVIVPIAHKILVTLGGSDPDNVTLKAIQALSQLSINNLEIIVAIGATNPHYEQLKSIVESLKLPIILQLNVTNMSELMAWADIAIAAGGSTNWELAFMGLPSLIITVANNQTAIAAELDRQSIVSHLGWHQQVTSAQISQSVHKLIGDRAKRVEMSQKGQKLIDGKGGGRVVSAIANVLN
jgi:UDP-2,4-diacetamido-2,4,6-trideoxy-beta-L-altropyranose hydrolase